MLFVGSRPYRKYHGNHRTVSLNCSPAQGSEFVGSGTHWEPSGTMGTNGTNDTPAVAYCGAGAEGHGVGRSLFTVGQSSALSNVPRFTLTQGARVMAWVDHCSPSVSVHRNIEP